MGNKNRNKKKNAAAPTYQESEFTDDPSFAEKLLSSMGIDSPSTKTDKNIDNSAIEEVDEPTEAFENRHPHLHSIKERLSKVIHSDSSKSASASATSVETSPSVQSTRESVESVSSRYEFSSESPPRSSEESISISNGTRITVREVPESKPAVPEATSGKRRNRRKEKLAERERERARIVQEAEAEASTIPDKRLIELKGMGMAISQAGLEEHESQPDGHCLFHSLSDQLDTRMNIKTTAQELRATLARYIRENADDFLPYLIEDESGDVVSIEKYTYDLENTPMWGGDLEIMAASCYFETPIRVYFASQAPLDVNEDKFDGKEPLKLAYYQAKFGLGAHYNSLRDKKTAEAPNQQL